jgi:tellurite resistance protein TehA-like permease
MIFPVYWAEETYPQNTTYSFYLMPIFFYSTWQYSDSPDLRNEKQIICPLLYYNLITTTPSEKKTADKSETIDSTILLPIIPVIYYSSASHYSGTHRNVLLLIDGFYHCYIMERMILIICISYPCIFPGKIHQEITI